MSYPKIKFQLNKSLDLQIALIFKNIKAGGINFRKWGILAPHPKLKKYKKLTRAILQKYLDCYYHANRRQLLKTKKVVAEKWRSKEKLFWRLTNNAFNNHPSPPGKYICYLSIWNCNPRDLNEKTFQLFLKQSNPVETIAHELLHFMFFDFINKNFSSLFDQKKLWTLSEVFNTLVMNTPGWRKNLELKKQYPYPTHKILYQKHSEHLCASTAENFINCFLKNKQ